MVSFKVHNDELRRKQMCFDHFWRRTTRFCVVCAQWPLTNKVQDSPLKNSPMLSYSKAEFIFNGNKMKSFQITIAYYDFTRNWTTFLVDVVRVSVDWCVNLIIRVRNVRRNPQFFISFVHPKGNAHWCQSTCPYYAIQPLAA